MPVELEKQNLEMHVELQALRDKAVNESLDLIEDKIKNLVAELKELRELLDDMKDDRNHQLLKWGTAIIAALFSALGMLIIKLLAPLFLGK